MAPRGEKYWKFVIANSILTIYLVLYAVIGTQVTSKRLRPVFLFSISDIGAGKSRSHGLVRNLDSILAVKLSKEDTPDEVEDRC